MVVRVFPLMPAFILRVESFGPPVYCVFSEGSGLQVLRIDTHLIIARVHDAESVRNTSDFQCVYISVHVVESFVYPYSRISRSRRPMRNADPAAFLVYRIPNGSHRLRSACRERLLHNPLFHKCIVSLLLQAVKSFFSDSLPRRSPFFIFRAPLRRACISRLRSAGCTCTRGTGCTFRSSSRPSSSP